MQYLSGVPQYSSHLKWWIPGGWNDIWHQIPFRHPPLPVRFISGLARVPREKLKSIRQIWNATIY